MIDLHLLHSCYPHLTSIIPAACLFKFDLEYDNCIPKNLELCLNTDGEDLKFTTTHSIDLNTNIFYLDPENHTIFDDYSKLMVAGFKPFVPHTDPYQLLLIFCNHPALLCALTPTSNDHMKPIVSSKILKNCILTFNRFKHQSEPFKIDVNRREYQVKMAHYGQESYIQPCSTINSCYLNAIVRARDHGQITSQSILCHQGNLYKKCRAIDASQYYSPLTHIAKITRVSKIFMPIEPHYSANLLETVSITDFNFLYATNPTEQLKALLEIHTFKHNQESKQVYESIAHIHLVPIEPAKIKYMIIFNQSLAIHSLFIAVLRRFFQLLHPINIEVIVDYAVQPL